MITGTSQASFKASTTFTTLSFSSNGKLLASGGSDGKIRIWNTEAKQEGWLSFVNQFLPSLTIKAHKGKITNLIYSQDGKVLLSGSSDGTIKAWETTLGRQKFVCIGHTSRISQLAVSEKGKNIISTHDLDSRLAQHWNVDGGYPLSGFNFKNKSILTISPDAKTFVIKDWRGKGKYKLWNISKKGIQTTLKGLENIHLALFPTFVFSSDSKMLATSTNSRKTSTRNEKEVIHIWNTSNDSGSFLSRLFINFNSIRPIHTYKNITGGALVLTVSPNGKLLGYVSRGKAETIYLLNVETGSKHFALAGHSQRISVLVFSLDGTTLASVSDKEIILWDVTTGKQLRTCPIEKNVKSMLFSPDGKKLICGGFDGSLRLWDTHTGNLLSTHIGHTDPITTMLFLEDGNTLVSGSWDGTILLWDWGEITAIQ